MTVAIEAVFQQMIVEWRRLRDSLEAFRLTADEDRPSRGEAMAADELSYAAADMLGWCRESEELAAQGVAAAAYPMDLERVRRALTGCQEGYNRTLERFAGEVAYNRIAQLRNLALSRGGEWAAWSKTAEEALERCRMPLQELNRALFRCWQEIAERVGMTSVSVQATNIGQKIELAQDEILSRSGAS